MDLAGRTAAIRQFRKRLCNARVSVGGDSDTIGAITGSLAEAYYGIPDALKRKALSFPPEDMLKIYREFGSPDFKHETLVGEKNLSRTALPIVYDTKVLLYMKLDFLHSRSNQMSFAAHPPPFEASPK